jgi:hypothetical protein
VSSRGDALSIAGKNRADPVPVCRVQHVLVVKV